MLTPPSEGPLRIGFLQPYSTLYPHYSEHFLVGFFLGFGRDPYKQNDIQFIPHYTGTGERKAVAEALRKLFYMDKVAMMSGWASYSTLLEVSKSLNMRGALGSFFDMGEFLPLQGDLSPNAFFSSQQLWQSEFALGRWAPGKFGENGALVMGLYESGYHLSTAFQKGVAFARKGDLINYIMKSSNPDLHDIDIPPLIEHLQKQKPDYVHVILCGPNSVRFLHAWSQCSLHREVPLLVSENMMYDEWLSDIEHLNLELYTGSLYDKNSEMKENQIFCKQFREFSHQDVNIFALLGYEMGLLFKEVFQHMKTGDWDKVHQLMQTEVVVGPRGERNFNLNSKRSYPSIDIIKVKTSKMGSKKLILDQAMGIPHDAPIFDDIRDVDSAGWSNPFMCI